MKFACESCATKYVIPDDRVAGKMLRVRCKRCRAVMEVVGPSQLEGPPRRATKPEKVAAIRNQDVAQDRPIFSAKQPFDPFVAAGGSGKWGLDGSSQELGEASGAFQVGSAAPVTSQPVPAAMWHVAIKGQSRGPFTQEELELLARRGRIHTRTRVWTHGMDEWIRIVDIEELSGVKPWLQERARQPGASELTPSSGSNLPAPIEAVQPSKPFANLLASHPSFGGPPPAPVEETPIPVIGSGFNTGGTGWFAVSPDQVEQLFELTPSSHVPGTTPMITGVHLLHRKPHRVLHAVLGLTALAVLVAAFAVMPLLLDAPEGVIRDTSRSPVQAGQVEAHSDLNLWARVVAMQKGDSKAAPVVEERKDPSAVERVTEAMKRSASEALQK